MPFRNLILCLGLLALATPTAAAHVADELDDALLPRWDEETVPCLPIEQCDDPCTDHELDRMYCELIANLPDPIREKALEAWAAIRNGARVGSPV